MRALVTGGAGFIGRHAIAELERRGHDVINVDLALGRDARDYFRTYVDRFDLVIHCAAVVGGRLKIEGAPLEVAVDLSIDAELFGWALRTRPGAIVYYSSSAAYPTDLQNNIGARRLEEDDIDIANPLGAPDLTYGWSKLTGELLAEHARAAGIRTHVLRPFSGYGADQDLDYPWPTFLERARRHDNPFTVWGDGNAARDFIHVDDVIAATLAIVDAGIEEPINLGTGRATTFNELARMAMHAFGYEAPIHHDRDKPVGVEYRVADVRRLHDIYVPRITLEEAFAKAAAE